MRSRGLWGMIFWLTVGFSCTELTVMALSAYLQHESLGHRYEMISALLPEQIVERAHD